jgi:hypothetical protein
MFETVYKIDTMEKSELLAAIQNVLPLQDGEDMLEILPLLGELAIFSQEDAQSFYDEKVMDFIIDNFSPPEDDNELVGVLAARFKEGTYELSNCEPEDREVELSLRANWNLAWMMFLKKWLKGTEAEKALMEWNEAH